MAEKIARSRPGMAKRAHNKFPAEARIIAISLVNTNVTYSIGADEEGEYSYSAVVGKPLPLEGGSYVYRCTIEISKNKSDSDETSAGFSASYMCGFHYDGEPDTAHLIARRLSVTAIWAMFTSLFAVVAQQIGVDFPSLPSHPKNVSLAEE
ncbi:hypothetical protein LJR098_002297 [Rhizobium sp. LjRoot98]|uniref:hypothetical protein n=1 Tax=Rhizobium sp. LjRoot98 TaxID=3342345 RepID=UPI003ECDDF15